MPSNTEKEAIHSRLKALLDAVYEEALRSPDFFDRIERILLSPEARLAVHKPTSTPSRQSINIVEILHQDGEAGLRSVLSGHTNEDLTRLCVQEGIKKMKDAKSLDRDALIEVLMQTASSRLKQGESFTKKNG
jgi:hypothetical protein